jgi:hypothetical protein
MVGFLKSIFGGKRKPMSVVEFRDLFVARLREAYPDAEIEIVSDTALKLTRGDLEGSAYVENVYGSYVRDPAHLDFHMGKLLSLVANSSPESPQGVNQLVVVARPVDYGRALGADVLMRPLAGDVGLLLAFDTPTALGGAIRSSLEEMELTEDEAFARAVENLSGRVGEFEVQRFEHANVFHIKAESGLATGLLALPDRWRNGVSACVVFVVNREAFLWCDLADADAVRALGQFARVVQVHDAVSKMLLVLENGVWRELGS